MPWEVEYTDGFGHWWHGLSEDQQDAVADRVELLMEYGPNLPYPYSRTSGVRATESCEGFERRAAAGPSGSSLRP